MLFGIASGRLADGGALDGLAATCQFLIEVQGVGAASLFTNAYCTVTAADRSALTIQISCIGRDDRCEGGWYMTGGTGRFTGAKGDGAAIIDAIRRDDRGGASGVTSLHGLYELDLPPE
ncbi:MAG: hypothetical protein KIS96_12790 [Bauldia sp.]|nr:hypothetical protein [Bauldia sp.]